MKQVITFPENEAGILRTDLPIKDAIFLFLVAHDQVPLCLPIFQHKNVLMLRGCSFS
jgi:hypothetical protein